METDTATLTDDRTMTLSRWFRASPAQVYAAWTDPGILPRWFGPKGWTCETHAMDLRVGGEWRFARAAVLAWLGAAA